MRASRVVLIFRLAHKLNVHTQLLHEHHVGRRSAAQAWQPSGGRRRLRRRCRRPSRETRPRPAPHVPTDAARAPPTSSPSSSPHDCGPLRQSGSQVSSARALCTQCSGANGEHLRRSSEKSAEKTLSKWTWRPWRPRGNLDAAVDTPVDLGPYARCSRPMQDAAMYPGGQLFRCVFNEPQVLTQTPALALPSRRRCARCVCTHALSTKVPCDLSPTCDCHPLARVMLILCVAFQLCWMYCAISAA